MSDQTKARLRQAVLEKYAEEMWAIIDAEYGFGCHAEPLRWYRKIKAELEAIDKL